MKFPVPLESRAYGNPEDIVSAQQTQKARAQKRRILTVKPGWSEARKRAEELFSPPPPIRER
jgi:hypothetical protein